MKKSLFSKVLIKGVLGAFAGIIAGLILSFIIWTLQNMVNTIHTWNMSKEDYSAPGSPPLEALVTLGMAFGAIIGSIFGSLTGLKEEKK